MKKSLRYTLLSLAAAASLALTACGGDGGTTPDSVNAAESAPTLTISEAWAKAADSGMTSAFGVIKNSSDQAVTVIGASSASATSVELHETVQDANGTMKMRPKEGGFTIPAHGEFLLEPGAGHIMLMGLDKPILAGHDITITLELSTGGKLEFTAPGKDFSGANENYSGDADMGGMDHGGMDMGGTPTPAGK